MTLGFLKPFDDPAAVRNPRVSCGQHVHNSAREAYECVRERVKSNGRYLCSHCGGEFYQTHMICHHGDTPCCEVDVPVEMPVELM